LFDAAEFEESLAASFLRRHARTQVVFDVQLNMVFQFLGKLLLASLSAE
jgi:hypothetical protein